ncbi:hypothetical protein FF1_037258 [Malus domestica]
MAFMTTFSSQSTHSHRVTLFFFSSYLPLGFAFEAFVWESPSSVAHSDCFFGHFLPSLRSNEARRETLMAARTISIIFAMLVLGCHSVSAAIFGNIHIDVENRVLPKADVELHCKSKNDDLGNHVIPPSGAYNFTFHDNLWDTTLFYCNVQWRRLDGK